MMKPIFGDFAYSGTFSHDLRLLDLAAHHSTVKVRGDNNGKCLQTLPCDSGLLVTFPRDFKLLVSVSTILTSRYDIPVAASVHRPSLKYSTS